MCSNRSWDLSWREVGSGLFGTSMLIFIGPVDFSVLVSEELCKVPEFCLSPLFNAPQLPGLFTFIIWSFQFSYRGSDQERLSPPLCFSCLPRPSRALFQLSPGSFIIFSFCSRELVVQRSNVFLLAFYTGFFFRNTYFMTTSQTFFLRNVI